MRVGGWLNINIINIKYLFIFETSNIRKYHNLESEEIRENKLEARSTTVLKIYFLSDSITSSCLQQDMKVSEHTPESPHYGHVCR